MFSSIVAIIGGFAWRCFQFDHVKADHWIAFALLFIIGLKMIMDGRYFKLKEKILDVSSLKVIILLSLATSIDAFIVGISFSMMWTIMQQVIAILAIFIATFLFSFMGVKMGEKVHFIKPRIALFTGGAILILIGVKTLIEHLYF
ncbi:MAG: manganese efflux pump [Bacteroidales bacterium]|nr:manganese efflux pump [Bacteroidales bacterium]